jgi:hypothetical protein
VRKEKEIVGEDISRKTKKGKRIRVDEEEIA